MSKKNKAAQAAASTAAKPAETAKVAETTKAAKTEKVEETQQVDNKAKEEKKPEAAKVDKKPAQKGAEQPKQKKDKTPTVIAEDITHKLLKEANMGIPVASKGSSTDAKAMLAYVGHERFTKNEQLAKENPEFYNAINQSINVVWLLGMIGIQQELAEMGATGKLKLIVSADQVMPLQEIATQLGITLAAPRALPGVTDGNQLAFPFSEAEGTVIPEQLKDKGPSAKLPDPDLEVEKVGSDHEKICAALDFLLRRNRNLVTSLVNTVEWYRKLCIHNAVTADAKLAIDNKNINDWIEEIFHLVPVSGLLKGLGRSVYLYTKTEESPVSAHCLLHGQLKDYAEEDIVRILRVLIQENFRYNLEDKVDAKGEVMKTNKVENPTDDKAILATLGNLGVDYVDKLMSDYTAAVPEGATDEQLNEIKEARNKARKIMSLVRANYYPGKVEPTNEQLRFAVGKIINAYRSPMDQIAEFEGPIPVLVGEYPVTEKQPAEEKKS